MRKQVSSRTRKALAGVLGGMILFAMIFTTGLGFFIFVSTTNLRQEQAAANTLRLQLDQKQEQFQVVPILQSGNIAFYMINTGGISINLTMALISSPGTLQTLQGPPSFPITLNPGATSATISSGIAPAPNVQYNIKVLTKRGTVALGIYPSAEVIAQLAIPKIGYSFGSMKIMSCCYALIPADQNTGKPPKDGKDHVAVGNYTYRNPLLQWEEIGAAYWFLNEPKDVPWNTTIWVTAWFYNLETYDVYIKTGSILIQVGFGGEASGKNKVFYMGGTLAEPVVIKSGLLGQLKFRVAEIVKELSNTEKKLKEIAQFKDLPWEFGGVATFSGTRATADPVYDKKFKTLDPDFRTGAILMDGISVYGINMLAPSELTFSRDDDGIGWSKAILLTVASYKRDATVPFTVTVSGCPGGMTCVLSTTTATPSASGVGLAAEVTLTLTVNSLPGTCECNIKVKVTSTQTVAKVKPNTFELVTIENNLLLHVVP